MLTKVCTKCGEELPATAEFFHKNKNGKYGLRGDCKNCIKQYKAQYRQENAEEIKQYKAQYYQENAEEIKQRMVQYIKKRRREDPQFRVRCNLGSRVSTAIKNFTKNGKKSAKTEKLLGTSYKNLMKHLESKFYNHPETGLTMTWENYGTMWHIDHIVPCAFFDLSDPEQQKQCFNWKNLQPLTWEDNLSKGDKELEEWEASRIKH